MMLLRAAGSLVVIIIAAALAAAIIAGPLWLLAVHARLVYSAVVLTGLMLLIVRRRTSKIRVRRRE